MFHIYLPKPPEFPADLTGVDLKFPAEVMQTLSKLGDKLDNVLLYNQLLLYAVAGAVVLLVLDRVFGRKA